MIYVQWLPWLYEEAGIPRRTMRVCCKAAYTLISPAHVALQATCLEQQLARPIQLIGGQPANLYVRAGQRRFSSNCTQLPLDM